MIHVGIDLEFTDHNCTQIMVEINHFFYFQGCGCGFKPKINQWISLTKKVDGDVIYYVYSWLHQDQFLVSKILTGHVTNFITPPIVIIYHGALLVSLFTPPFDFWLMLLRDCDLFFNKKALREKYPNTEFFLVPIFLYSDWTITK